MGPLILPLATWDTINTLCFDRKVLLVGVADGDDVVSLAQAAMVVAVYADVTVSDFTAGADKVADVKSMLESRSIRSRVLLHRIPSLFGITQYCEAQFDVVVYNPGACSDPDPAATAAQLANYGRRLIVVGDGVPEMWEQVLSQLPEGGFTASADGAAIFITLGAPEPIVRSD